MSPPAISVVIPVFRRQGELDCVLATLALQSFRAFEVVVVDDGSPEPISVEAGLRLGLEVRLLRAEPRGGANRARNLGVAAARAPLTALCDSDDLWFPEKLERQHAAWAALAPQQRDRVIVSCRSLVRGEGRVYVRPGRGQTGWLGDPVAAIFAPGALIQTSTLLLPTALARRLPFDEDLPIHHEPDLILRAYQAGAQVLMLEEALSVWDDRLRPDRLSVASLMAAEGWWRGVAQSVPPAVLQPWRLADRVLALRGLGLGIAVGLWGVLGEFGPANALKAALRLAAPRRYRALQEARFALNPNHRADPALLARLEGLLQAVH